VERRLAVHAGANELARRVCAAVALCAVASSSALAAPKSGEARVQFDRGVAAYTKGDYATAAEALGASFVLEADAETLFAWAQTERKLGHCDRAIDLYGKLLAMNLPEANRKAVQVQIDECKAVLAEQKPKVEPLPPPPPIINTNLEPIAPEPTPPSEPARESRAWWKDPVGGALVGGGAVVAGIGAVLLVQARNADADKASAATYSEYEALVDRAESRGRLGVIGLAVGGALVAGGIVWYVTRKPASEQTLTTLVPLPGGGGGVALSGRF
jgi:tetratricopeptide (TPR) repeat protein